VPVTDGGMLGARVLAALLRVRREPNFHRNNDRKLGEGMQGCARCELFRFFAFSGRFCGRSGNFRVASRWGREVKTRTLQKPKSAAPGKDKRLLQSGGRVGRPPWLTRRNMRGQRGCTKREDVASPLELSEITNRFAVDGRRFNAESQKD